ncbi:MAG: tetratricopeptide repeat protein [Planctomycetota bacterium]
MATDRDLYVLELILQRGLATAEEGGRLVAALREGRFASLAQGLRALKPWTPEQQTALDEVLKALPETALTVGAPATMGDPRAGSASAPTPMTLASTALRKTPAPGTGTAQLAFDRYEILEEIARGGMGIVYKGRDVKLNRVVALKVLVGAATPEMIERFRREAQMVAGLHHPRILPVHDVGDQDGLCYFTMDYVDGASLAQLIREKRVTRRQGIEILRDTALALQYAHEQGVIHRDVKPGNILVDVSGRTFLADFGVARATESQARLTASGHPIGTPQYMSPEQGGGDAASVDGRTDVYSLGATLYELLTGRPPYEGDSIMDIVFQLMTNDPPRPQEIDPKVPRDLELITLKAIERDRDRRYPTAKALAEELTRYLEGEAIEARPSGVFRHSWKRVRKHPVRATVLVAAAVAAAGWAAFVFWQTERDRGRSVDLMEQARRERDAGHHEEAIRLLGSAISLDGGNRAARVLEETCREQIRGREDRAKEEARLAEIELRNERRRRAQPFAETAQKILDMGDALARHGELARRRDRLLEAEGLLEKALAEDPEFAEALYARARVRRQIGREAEAIEDLEKAVAIRDTYSSPYIELISLRADLYKKARRPSAGIDRAGGPIAWSFRDVSKDEAAQELLARMHADLERVLAIGVRPEEAKYLRGTIAAMDGRPDEGIRELTEAIAVHPYYAEAYEKRAFAYLMRGDTDAALADVEEALELAPAFAEACCYRAMIRLARGDADGALEDFSRAAATDPEFGQAWSGIGLVHTTLGRWKEALAAFDKLIEVGPDSNAYFNRGTVLLNLKRFEEAKLDFDASIRVDERELGPWVHRAQAWLGLGKLAEAEKDLAKGAEIDPDHAVVRMTRSNLLKARGDLKGAIAEVNKAIAKNPAEAVFWFARADFKKEAGDATGALADLTAGLKLRPEDLRARSDRATLAAEAGDLGTAKADLDFVLDRVPQDAAMRNLRGRVLATMGDEEAALADLDVAVTEEPSAPTHRFFRGVIRMQAGKMTGAAEDLEAFLKLVPDGPESARVKELLEGARYWGAHPDDLQRVSKAADTLLEASDRAEKAYAVEDWGLATEEYRSGLAAIDACLAGADAELRRRVETGSATSRLLVNAWYNLACCQARRAELTEGADREKLLADALHALGESLRLGFDDLSHVREDRDLALLRGRKEFDALLAPK